MVEKVFKVFFDKFVSKDTQKKYLNAIKNEWNYHSIAGFLNDISSRMVKGDIIILNIDKPIIDKLMKKIKDRNYTDVREWFKDKIRDELNE